MYKDCKTTESLPVPTNVNERSCQQDRLTDGKLGL